VDRVEPASGSSSRWLARWLLPPFVVLIICTTWYFEDPRDTGHRVLDLTPSYIAGTLFIQGSYDAIYPRSEAIWPHASGGWHPAWQAEVERLGLELHDSFFAYNPLYIVLFMVPIAYLLSIQVFGVLVLVLNGYCAYYIGSETARLCSVENRYLRAVTGLLAALSFPATYAANFGQNTIIICAMLLLIIKLLASEQSPSASHQTQADSPPVRPGPGWRRLTLGAGLLCLIFIMKPWTFIALGYFLLTRRWLVLAWGSGAFVVVTQVLPRMVIPQELMNHYSSFASYLPFASCVACNNISLRGLIHRLSWPGWTQDLQTWRAMRVPSEVLALEMTLLAAMAALFVVILLWRKPRHEVVIVSTLAMLILVPGICWSYYLVFVIPVTAAACLLKSLSWYTRLLAALHACWLLAMHPHPVFFESVFRLSLLHYSRISYALLPYWLFLPMLAWLVLVFTLLLDPGAQAQERSDRGS
jgi:hypothetical protein